MNCQFVNPIFVCSIIISIPSLLYSHIQAFKQNLLSYTQSSLSMNPRFFFLPIIFLLFFTTTSQAQLVDSCRLQIGTNLAGPADWGSEWPFVNIMKYGRTWITQNNQWVGGGENVWDTQVLSQIPLDEQGYPLRLPVEIAGMEAPQMVLTVWANTEALPAGEYILLYEGTGTIGLWGDATVVSETPGRIVVNVTPGEADIMAMEISESIEGDHIRNIRFLLPDTEATYEANPWSEEWMEKLSPFNSLRFMDWGYTNGSRMINWEQRPQVTDYTYTIDGVPYEWWIELCNLKKADAWVCIPHEADDDYIRQMAQLFREDLDPDLKIYVEYSNEIWNWIFSQTHYCHDNGDQAVPWPERIVPFVQNALDIWTEEFADNPERIVRVVGVQASWQDVSNRVVFNMEPGSFDAFSPAAYFGLSEESISELENLGASATADHVVQMARQDMLDYAYGWMQEQHESIANELDIPMIYYEGGQHLTPQPFGSVQDYNPALVAAQTHPAMYELYNEWYDSLRTFSIRDEAALLMNFSFISPLSGQYGSWGLLESQFYQNAPYEEIAPKYQAVLDNIYDCSPVISSTPKLTENTEWIVYPNPTVGVFKLTLPSERRFDIRILNLQGQEVFRDSAYRGGDLLNTDLAPGLYVISVTDELGQWVAAERVVLVK
jgi:hypothetical protein